MGFRKTWKGMQLRTTAALKELHEKRGEPDFTDNSADKAMIRAQRYIAQAVDADDRDNPCRRSKTWRPGD